MQEGNFERIHKSNWTEIEKQIIKDNLDKTILELAELLPNRSPSAIKNKRKAMIYGKYPRHSKKRY